MKRKLIYKDIRVDFDIWVYQNGYDSFEVRYGLQVDKGLDYTGACEKIGQAAMHATACRGFITESFYWS